jgi:hypothetical protein
MPTNAPAWEDTLPVDQGQAPVPKWEDTSPVEIADAELDRSFEPARRRAELWAEQQFPESKGEELLPSFKGAVADIAGATARGIGALAKGAAVLEEGGYFPYLTGRWDKTAKYLMHPEQLPAALEKNPLYQAGRIAAKEGERAEEWASEREGEPVVGQALKGIFGLAPIVMSGPAAPATIAAQTVGAHDFQEEFDALRESGLSDEAAASKVIAKAIAGGMTQAAVWALLPPVMKKYADRLVGKAVDSASKSLLERGVEAAASRRSVNLTRDLAEAGTKAAEGAILGAASTGSGNIVEGQPVGEGVPESMLGLSTLFAGPHAVSLPLHAIRGTRIPTTPRRYDPNVIAQLRSEVDDYAKRSRALGNFEQQLQTEREQPDALRQRSTEGILSHQPEQAPEAGSERPGVGPVEQGTEASAASREAKTRADTGQEVLSTLDAAAEIRQRILESGSVPDGWFTDEAVRKIIGFKPKDSLQQLVDSGLLNKTQDGLYTFGADVLQPPDDIKLAQPAPAVATLSAPLIIQVSRVGRPRIADPALHEALSTPPALRTAEQKILISKESASAPTSVKYPISQASPGTTTSALLEAQPKVEARISIPTAPKTQPEVPTAPSAPAPALAETPAVSSLKEEKPAPPTVEAPKTEAAITPEPAAKPEESKPVEEAEESPSPDLPPPGVKTVPAPPPEPDYQRSVFDAAHDFLSSRKRDLHLVKPKQFTTYLKEKDIPIHWLTARDAFVQKVAEIVTGLDSKQLAEKSQKANVAGDALGHGYREKLKDLAATNWEPKTREQENLEELRTLARKKKPTPEDRARIQELLASLPVEREFEFLFNKKNRTPEDEARLAVVQPQTFATARAQELMLRGALDLSDPLERFRHESIGLGIQAQEQAIASNKSLLDDMAAKGEDSRVIHAEPAAKIKIQTEGSSAKLDKEVAALQERIAEIENTNPENAKQEKSLAQKLSKLEKELDEKTRGTSAGLRLQVEQIKRASAAFGESRLTQKARIDEAKKNGDEIPVETKDSASTFHEMQEKLLELAREENQKLKSRTVLRSVLEQRVKRDTDLLNRQKEIYQDSLELHKLVHPEVEFSKKMTKEERAAARERIAPSLAFAERFARDQRTREAAKQDERNTRKDREAYSERAWSIRKLQTELFNHIVKPIYARRFRNDTGELDVNDLGWYRGSLDENGQSVRLSRENFTQVLHDLIWKKHRKLSKRGQPDESGLDVTNDERLHRLGNQFMEASRMEGLLRASERGKLSKEDQAALDAYVDKHHLEAEEVVEHVQQMMDETIQQAQPIMDAVARASNVPVFRSVNLQDDAPNLPKIFGGMARTSGVSAKTTRMTAVFKDNQTGAVYVAGAYPKATDVMIVDPAKWKKTTTENEAERERSPRDSSKWRDLFVNDERVVKGGPENGKHRYTLMAAMLLDEPRRGFLQKFESEAAFMEFAKKIDAKREELQAQGQAVEQPRVTRAIEQPTDASAEGEIADVETVLDDPAYDVGDGFRRTKARPAMPEEVDLLMKAYGPSAGNSREEFDRVFASERNGLVERKQLPKQIGGLTDPSEIKRLIFAVKNLVNLKLQEEGASTNAEAERVVLSVADDIYETYHSTKGKKEYFAQTILEKYNEFERIEKALGGLPAGGAVRPGVEIQTSRPTGAFIRIETANERARHVPTEQQRLSKLRNDVESTQRVWKETRTGDSLIAFNRAKRNLELALAGKESEPSVPVTAETKPQQKAVSAYERWLASQAPPLPEQIPFGKTWVGPNGEKVVGTMPATVRQTAERLGMKPGGLVTRHSIAPDADIGRGMGIDLVASEAAKVFGGKSPELIKIVESDEPWSAQVDIDAKTGKVLEVRLNAKNLPDAESVARALEHEAAHAVTEFGGLAEELKTLKPEEIDQIKADMAERGYTTGDRAELDTRGVDTLVQAWKGRSWFGKLVSRVMDMFSGQQMTRGKAERAAARAVSEKLAELRVQDTRPEQAGDVITRQAARTPGQWKQQSMTDPFRTENEKYESRVDTWLSIEPMAYLKPLYDALPDPVKSILRGMKYLHETHALARSEIDNAYLNSGGRPLPHGVDIVEKARNAALGADNPNVFNVSMKSFLTNAALAVDFAQIKLPDKIDYYTRKVRDSIASDRAKDGGSWVRNVRDSERAALQHVVNAAANSPTPASIQAQHMLDILNGMTKSHTVMETVGAFIDTLNASTWPSTTADLVNRWDAWALANKFKTGTDVAAGVKYILSQSQPFWQQMQQIRAGAPSKETVRLQDKLKAHEDAAAFLKTNMLSPGTEFWRNYQRAQSELGFWQMQSDPEFNKGRITSNLGGADYTLEGVRILENPNQPKGQQDTVSLPGGWDKSGMKADLDNARKAARWFREYADNPESDPMRASFYRERAQELEERLTHQALATEQGSSRIAKWLPGYLVELFGQTREIAPWLGRNMLGLKAANAARDVDLVIEQLQTAAVSGKAGSRNVTTRNRKATIKAMRAHGFRSPQEWEDQIGNAILHSMAYPHGQPLTVGKAHRGITVLPEDMAAVQAELALYKAKAGVGRELKKFGRPEVLITEKIGGITVQRPALELTSGMLPRRINPEANDYALSLQTLAAKNGQLAPVIEKHLDRVLSHLWGFKHEHYRMAMRSPLVMEYLSLARQFDAGRPEPSNYVGLLDAIVDEVRTRPDPKDWMTRDEVKSRLEHELLRGARGELPLESPSVKPGERPITEVMGAGSFMTRPRESGTLPPDFYEYALASENSVHALDWGITKTYLVNYANSLIDLRDSLGRQIGDWDVRYETQSPKGLEKANAQTREEQVNGESLLNYADAVMIKRMIDSDLKSLRDYVSMESPLEPRLARTFGGAVRRAASAVLAAIKPQVVNILAPAIDIYRQGVAMGEHRKWMFGVWGLSKAAYATAEFTKHGGRLVRGLLAVIKSDDALRKQFGPDFERAIEANANELSSMTGKSVSAATRAALEWRRAKELGISSQWTMRELLRNDIDTWFASGGILDQQADPSLRLASAKGLWRASTAVGRGAWHVLQGVGLTSMKHSENLLMLATVSEAHGRIKDMTMRAREVLAAREALGLPMDPQTTVLTPAELLGRGAKPDEALQFRKRMQGCDINIDRAFLDYYARSKRAADPGLENLFTKEEENRYIFDLAQARSKSGFSNRPTLSQRNRLGRSTLTLMNWVLWQNEDILRTSAIFTKGNRGAAGIKAGAKFADYLLTASVLGGLAIVPMAAWLSEYVYGSRNRTPRAWDAENPEDAFKYMMLMAGSVLPLSSGILNSALDVSKPSRGLGGTGINLFAVEMANDIPRAWRTLYQGGDISQEMARLVSRWVPNSKLILNHTDLQAGMVENSNARANIDRFSQDIDKRTQVGGTYRPSITSAEAQDAVNWMMLGNTTGMLDARERGIKKIMEKRNIEYDAAAKSFDTSVMSRNPWQAVLGRAPTLEERGTILGRMSSDQRAEVMKAEEAFNTYAESTGHQAREFVRQERGSAGGGGGGSASIPSMEPSEEKTSTGLGRMGGTGGGMSFGGARGLPRPHAGGVRLPSLSAGSSAGPSFGVRAPSVGRVSVPAPRAGVGRSATPSMSMPASRRSSVRIPTRRPAAAAHVRSVRMPKLRRTGTQKIRLPARRSRSAVARLPGVR